MRFSLRAAVSRWKRPVPPREAGRVLCLAATDARRRRLARLASLAGLAYVEAGSLVEAGGPGAFEGAIVVVDRELAGDGWRSAVQLAAGEACVVLLAPQDGASLWEELASLGGFEVLPDASSDEEGVRLLRRARAWCRARAITR
jgi:hypothetical protein